MSERKFAKALRSKGVAAHIRENVSAALRESAIQVGPSCNWQMWFWSVELNSSIIAHYISCYVIKICLHHFIFLIHPNIILIVNLNFTLVLILKVYSKTDKPATKHSYDSGCGDCHYHDYALSAYGLRHSFAVQLFININLHKCIFFFLCSCWVFLNNIL